MASLALIGTTIALGSAAALGSAYLGDKFESQPKTVNDYENVPSYNNTSETPEVVQYDIEQAKEAESNAVEIASEPEPSAPTEVIPEPEVSEPVSEPSVSEPEPSAPQAGGGFTTPDWAPYTQSVTGEMVSKTAPLVLGSTNEKKAIQELNDVQLKLETLSTDILDLDRKIDELNTIYTTSRTAYNSAKVTSDTEKFKKEAFMNQLRQLVNPKEEKQGDSPVKLIREKVPKSTGEDDSIWITRAFTDIQKVSNINGNYKPKKVSGTLETPDEWWKRIQTLTASTSSSKAKLKPTEVEAEIKRLTEEIQKSETSYLIELDRQADEQVKRDETLAKITALKEKRKEKQKEVSELSEKQKKLITLIAPETIDRGWFGTKKEETPRLSESQIRDLSVKLNEARKKLAVARRAYDRMYIKDFKEEYDKARDAYDEPRQQELRKEIERKQEYIDYKNAIKAVKIAEAAFSGEPPPEEKLKESETIQDFQQLVKLLKDNAITLGVAPLSDPTFLKVMDMVYKLANPPKDKTLVEQIPTIKEYNKFFKTTPPWSYRDVFVEQGFFALKTLALSSTKADVKTKATELKGKIEDKIKTALSNLQKFKTGIESGDQAIMNTSVADIARLSGRWEFQQRIVNFGKSIVPPPLKTSNLDIINKLIKNFTERIQDKLIGKIIDEKTGKRDEGVTTGVVKEIESELSRIARYNNYLKNELREIKGYYDQVMEAIKDNNIPKGKRAFDLVMKKININVRLEFQIWRILEVISGIDTILSNKAQTPTFTSEMETKLINYKTELQKTITSIETWDSDMLKKYTELETYRDLFDKTYKDKPIETLKKESIEQILDHQDNLLTQLEESRYINKKQRTINLKSIVNKLIKDINSSNDKEFIRVNLSSFLTYTFEESQPEISAPAEAPAEAPAKKEPPNLKCTSVVRQWLIRVKDKTKITEDEVKWILSKVTKEQLNQCIEYFKSKGEVINFEAPAEAPAETPIFKEGNKAPEIKTEENFIEKQESAGCGRHALNNLLGGLNFVKDGPDIDSIQELPIPVPMQSLCRYIVKKIPSLITDNPECPDNENYHYSVLVAGLQLYGYSVEYDGTVFEGKDSAKTFKENIENTNPTNLIGFILHNPGHWTALRYNSKDNYTFLDSQGDNIEGKIGEKRGTMKTDTLDNLYRDFGRMQNPDGYITVRRGDGKTVDFVENNKNIMVAPAEAPAETKPTPPTTEENTGADLFDGGRRKTRRQAPPFVHLWRRSKPSRFKTQRQY